MEIRAGGSTIEIDKSTGALRRIFLSLISGVDRSKEIYYNVRRLIFIRLIFVSYLRDAALLT